MPGKDKDGGGGKSRGPPGPPRTGPPAPDGGWGWMIILGTILSQIVYGIVVRAFGVTYLEMLERYGSSAMATGWVGAINMTAAGLFGPLITAMCVRFGCRMVVFIGAFVMAGGIGATAFVPSLPYVYVTYGVVSGLGLSMVYTPGFLIVGEYFEKRKAMAMAIANLGTGLGALIFPPMVLFLFEEFGYEGAFVILAGICLHCIISAGLFRPLKAKAVKSMDVESGKKPEGKTEMEKDGHPEEMKALTETETVDEKTKDEKSNVESGASSEKTGPVKQVKPAPPGGPGKKPPMFDFKLLREKRFLGSALLVLSVAITMALASAFLPALAMENGLDMTQASFLLSVSGISSTIGALGFGAPLDHRFIRPYRVRLFGLFNAIVGISNIFSPLCFNYGSFIFFTFLRSTFASVIISQRATMVADLVGGRRVPSAFGWLLLSHSFGSLIGRVAGGTLRDVGAGYAGSFYMAGAVNIVTTLLFFIAIPPFNLRKMISKLRGQSDKEEQVPPIVKNRS